MSIFFVLLFILSPAHADLSSLSHESRQLNFEVNLQPLEQAAAAVAETRHQGVSEKEIRHALRIFAVELKSVLEQVGSNHNPLAPNVAAEWTVRALKAAVTSGSHQGDPILVNTLNFIVKKSLENALQGKAEAKRRAIHEHEASAIGIFTGHLFAGLSRPVREFSRSQKVLELVLRQFPEPSCESILYTAYTVVH